MVAADPTEVVEGVVVGVGEDIASLVEDIVVAEGGIASLVEDIVVAEVVVAEVVICPWD